MPFTCYVCFEVCEIQDCIRFEGITFCYDCSMKGLN